MVKQEIVVIFFKLLLDKFRCVCIVDKLLPLLLSCLNKDSGKVQTIAASALLGLVFNNQKVYPQRMLIILVFDIYGQFKFLWSMCICCTVKYNYASIDIAGQSNDEECQFAAKIARNLIQPQQSPINTRKMCARFDICAYYSVRVNRL